VFNPISFKEFVQRQNMGVEQVKKFVEQEEVCLLQRIFQAFQLPAESIDTEERRRFSRAIDAVSDRIDAVIEKQEEKLSADELKGLIGHLNAAYRRYEDMLESCAAQIYYDLEAVPIDLIKRDNFHELKEIHAYLKGRLNESLRQYKRFEKKLFDFQSYNKSRYGIISALSRMFVSVLDKTIPIKLKRILDQISDHFNRLKDRYESYDHMAKQADERVRKFDEYKQFHTLPKEDIELFRRIYWLMKMHELDRQGGEVLKNDIMKMLGQLSSPKEINRIFHEYYALLKNALFELSGRLTERGMEELENEAIREEIQSNISGLRAEIHSLGSLIFKVRDYILRSHPDPYVRARLGFSEHTVGPEPEETRQLATLGHQVEVLDKRFTKFSVAVDEFKPSTKSIDDLRFFDAIIMELEENIWEAKSKGEAQSVFQTCLQELGEAHELYSFDPFRVMGIERVLRLALRIDFFNVLVKEPLFLELYETHVKIRGQIRDESQRNLLEKLSEINDEYLNRIKVGAQKKMLRQSVLTAKADWLLAGDKIVKSLEGFVAEMKGRMPLPLEALVGPIHQRRKEVLEFLFAFRQFSYLLENLGIELPDSMNLLLSRIHKVETDFSSLSAQHVSQEPGLLSADQLWGLDNL
jgi:hypothetical protein